MATLQLPSMGYGLRYEYGMFKQQVVDGYQVETPDYWLLTRGNPWEFPAPGGSVSGSVLVEDLSMKVIRCAGLIRTACWPWAYDTIIPGFGTNATSTLRLWSAKATTEMNLSAFNRGEYVGAVHDKTMSENITRILYPDDSTEQGRELRFAPGIFLCFLPVCKTWFAAHMLNHDSLDSLPDNAAIHLNDTHPVLGHTRVDAYSH